MMPNLGISSFLESIRDFHGLFWEKFPGQYFQKKIDSSERNREYAILHEQSGEFWILM